MSVNHYENFPVGSLVLPRRLRKPVHAVYAFARTADDIADEGEVADAVRLCRLEELQKELDEKLWTFNAESFIGHGINQPDAAVCISEQLPDSAEWIIFNFNNHALEHGMQFSHIIEIIENTEAAKQIGREKFKFYRRLGVEPRTFKL